MKPVRIAVIGGGHMGALHAAKVAALRDTGGDVTLAGVADVDVERARRVASRNGSRAAGNGLDLFGAADAVIVAVPTAVHFEVVKAALESGLDVLVEKPIAATLGEAEELLALSRSRGRVLRVGHLEWFNGAMRVIRAKIQTPRFVEAQRMGPFPERAADTDVIRDLMIHDLGILQQVLGEEPDRIEAIGIPVITDKVDIANARIGFPCGCVANLTASRVSATPMRKLRFFQRDAYFSVDLLAQSGAIFRRRVSGDGRAPHLEMEKLEIDPEDALLAQLRAFVEAVRTRRGPPVSGGEALAALRTALRVVEAIPPLDELQ
jgi:predicted dehydrogenase